MPLTTKVGQRYVHALDDGFFKPQPSYFDRPDVYDRLAQATGHLETPIGAFLFPGAQNVLVDAGLGPIDYLGRGRLVGGKLLDELRLVDVDPDQIDVLALSHLHPDHAGWLATPDGGVTFKKARVVFGSADWQHFLVDHRDQIADHLAVALDMLMRQGRVELVEGESEIAPGVRLLPAPGHTPGHSVFALHDHGDRMLLLGDAIFCPLQLTESDIGTLSDIDKELSRCTRVALAREMERHDTQGVGCHFPGLVAGRLITNEWSPSSH